MDIDDQVRQLFYSAVERYPNNKLTDRAKVEYQADWIRLARQVGLERFSNALAEARLHCSFIPQASEINDHMQAPLPGNHNRHDPNCKLCGGLGLRPFPVRQGEKYERWGRCEG